MRDVVRLLRAVLAVALLGLGPATRAADLLIYHSSGAPALASHQADDGTLALPHGDGCLLAVPSAPATPAMACGQLLPAPPTSELPELLPLHRPMVLRATGPPATRAPPA